MDIANWPKSVQNGVMFLIAGWLGVYGFMAAFTYFYGQDGQVFTNRLILQTVILGVGLSYFVIQKKNWARIISVFGNTVPMLLAMTYLMYVHLFHAIRLNWLISLLSFLVLVFFGLSIYYLTRPDCVTHFKLSSDQAHDSSEENSTN